MNEGLNVIEKYQYDEYIKKHKRKQAASWWVPFLVVAVPFMIALYALGPLLVAQ